MCREGCDLARGRDPLRLDRSADYRCGSVLCILLLFGTFLDSEARRAVKSGDLIVLFHFAGSVHPPPSGRTPDRDKDDADKNGNGTPDVHRILGGSRTRQPDHAYPRMNNDIKDAGDQGDLYIGHSGDPWSASSGHNYEEDVYARVSSPTNVLINSTKAQSAVSNRQGTSHTRFKRGVVHLYNMVVCATGCNPLVYKGYGCYCGFLGSGYVIDGIDQCCKMHDWCYDATECPMFSEYFVPYYWRCYHGYKPVCAVEHGDWGGSGSCSQRLCECDRSLAECLRRYPCPTTKAVCTSSPWRLVQNLFMII